MLEGDSDMQSFLRDHSLKSSRVDKYLDSVDMGRIENGDILDNSGSSQYTLERTSPGCKIHGHKKLPVDGAIARFLGKPRVTNVPRRETDKKRVPLTAVMVPVQNPRVSDAPYGETDKQHAHETEVMVPRDFICGISKKVIKDPVVLASGVTFERESIQAWLDSGNTHCPVSGVPLAHLNLVPNLTLKNLIYSWMESHSGPLITRKMHSDSFSSSSFDSFASCPNFDSSTKGQQHSFTSTSLPKLLRDAEFLGFDSLYSFKTSSYPKDSFSSSDCSSCSEHGRDAHSQCPDHNLSFDSVNERESIMDPRFRRAVKDVHMRRNLESDLSWSPMYTLSRITSLVANLQSDHIDKQRSAVSELRLLAKHNDSNRMMIMNAGALAPVLTLLRSQDDATQQEATTTLLNLSLNPTIREEAMKAGAVELLVKVVKEGMTSVAMENAAVALVNLSVDEESKMKIGAADAIPPLLELIDNGSMRGKKDAATALYSLTSINENKRRMVRGGATRLLVNFLSDEDNSEGMVDKSIALLRNLVSIEEGRVAFVAEGGIKSLMKIMKAGSRRSKDLAVSILYQLCSNSTKHRSLVLQNEPLPLLIDLSNSGTSRVKAEAAEVMRVLMDSKR